MATLAVLALAVLAAHQLPSVFDVGDVGAALIGVSWPWLVASVLIYALSQFSSALVWREGLRAAGVGDLPTRAVLSAHWISRGASELLPAQLGEAARVAALRTEPRLAGRTWQVIGSIGAFKLVDGFISLAVATAILLVAVGPAGGIELRLAGCAACAVVLGLLVAMPRLARMGAIERLPAGVGPAIARLLEGAAIVRQPRRLACAAGHQGVATVGKMLAVGLLLVAFGLPLAAMPVAYAVLVLTGLLPISPGGVGVREAVLVPVLVAGFAAAPEVALAASLTIQVSGLVVSLAGAAIALAAGAISPRAVLRPEALAPTTA